jgi:uncharacterized Fe-S radical SAM superfamily protein PflX
MLNKTPAKFMILKSIPVDVKLDDASDEELWKHNDELHREALKLFDEYFEKMLIQPN